MVIYRLWRNKVTQLIKEAKTKYYQNAIEENEKIGYIWKCLREINQKINHCSPNLLENNGEVAETPIDIANTFNNFFLNLSKHFSHSDSDNSHTLQVLSEYAKRKLPENQQFKISHITEDEVFSMLRNADVSDLKSRFCCLIRKLFAIYYRKHHFNLIEIKRDVTL